MGRRRVLTPLAVLALAGFPAAAAAAPGDSCADAGDNASVSEYCESIPSVGGQRGVGDRDSDRDKAHDKALQRVEAAPQAAATPSSDDAPASAVAGKTPSRAPKARKRAAAKPKRARQPEASPARDVAVAPARSVSTSSLFGGIPTGIFIAAGLIVVAGIASARWQRAGGA